MIPLQRGVYALILSRNRTLPASIVSQLLSDQHDPYTKVAYLGLVNPKCSIVNHGPKISLSML